MASTPVISLLPLILAGGCHLVLPLGSVSDVGATDRAAPDAPRDAGPSTDGPPSIEPRQDLPRKDIPVDTGAPLDGGPDASVQVLCQGLSLYLPFDTSCMSGIDGAGAAVVGTSQTAGGGSVAFQLSGFIGSGCSLTGNGELRWPPALYSAAAGTVSLWVRITYKGFPPAYTLYLHRAHWGAGPTMYHNHLKQHLGVTNSNADGGFTELVADNTAAQPYWSASWNHLVSTWNQSGSERLSFTLNGDPANGYPTRLTSGAFWSPATPTPYSFSVGGSTEYTTAAAYVVDEVALWNRPLSLAEIKLLHSLQSSGQKSIGQICGLP